MSLMRRERAQTSPWFPTADLWKVMTAPLSESGVKRAEQLLTSPQLNPPSGLVSNMSAWTCVSTSHANLLTGNKEHPCAKVGPHVCAVTYLHLTEDQRLHSTSKRAHVLEVGTFCLVLTASGGRLEASGLVFRLGFELGLAQAQG